LSFSCPAPTFRPLGPGSTAVCFPCDLCSCPPLFFYFFFFGARPRSVVSWGQLVPGLGGGFCWISFFFFPPPLFFLSASDYHRQPPPPVTRFPVFEFFSGLVNDRFFPRWVSAFCFCPLFWLPFFQGPPVSVPGFNFGLARALIFGALGQAPHGFPLFPSDVPVPRNPPPSCPVCQLWSPRVPAVPFATYSWATVTLTSVCSAFGAPTGKTLLELTRILCSPIITPTLHLV